MEGGKNKKIGKERLNKIIRSDGRTFHVDFENVADTLICARNAGVIIDHATRAKILNNFGYDGKRCAHIVVNTTQEVARLQLLRAYDAPTARENAVLEFVYRPALDKTVDLVDWPIVCCYTQGGAPGYFERNFLNDAVFGMDGAEGTGENGRPKLVGVVLRANGKAGDGTYDVDVIAKGGRFARVLRGLPQTTWVRFIMHRADKMVALYAGIPGREKQAGTYEDILSEEEVFAVVLGNPDDPQARGSGYWDSFRLGYPLKPGAKVAPAERPVRNVAVAIPSLPKRLTVSMAKMFFIDDWIVENTSNIRRTFHRPDKYPQNPIITCDQPWEKFLVLVNSVEQKHDGSLRMWYGAYPDTGNSKKRCTCIADSRDGIHWTKPELGVCEYNGSKANNICFSDASIQVITNAEDPRPQFRYTGKIRHKGTQGLSSPDGIHWQNHGVILPQSLDASSVHWDPVRKKYVASIKLGYKGRRVRGYAESKDFLHWTDSYLMMDVDEKDVYGDQLYAMSIFRYESLYLGLCKVYHVGTSDRCDIQLAVSHNCFHWERPYRALPEPKFVLKQQEGVVEYPDPYTQPFIPTGPAGSWEYGNNDQASTAPIRRDDKLFFYYSGRPCNHSHKFPEGFTWGGSGKSAIGLATLRVDGFVSADADPSGGFIVTKPFSLMGNNLYVNVDSAKGRFQVEVLDVHWKPIRGFEESCATPISADSIREKCSWKRGDNIGSLKGKTIRLKFYLSGASLFSFWCE